MEVTQELLDCIGDLWESLVKNGIVDEDEVLTGLEIINIATNYINTHGRFGD